MASDYNVQFRAVHTRNTWRKAKHYDMENALRGRSGAIELFAKKGRIDYEENGDPLYVIAWESGSTTGIAVKSDGNGGLVEQPVSIDFDDSVGISAKLLDELFRSGSTKPSYWWVNHKKTYKQEHEGSYIWSPKTKRNGDYHQTYTNLTLVKPGDVVISYGGAQLRAIGVVIGRHQGQPKPEELRKAGENWSEDGWLVPVVWSVLKQPIAPKKYLERIVDMLPEKYSPLKRDGNGNENCYLGSISPELGNFILNLVPGAYVSAVDGLRELENQREADAVEQQIKGDKSLSETERNQLVRSRLGQGKFRQRVQKVERSCRLTGVADERFLIASHIKPWKKCTNEQRLDGHNGLMLAPHVDKLFDRGWISFADNGDLLVAANVPQAVMDAWGFIAGLNAGPFSAKQKVYLKYHRTKVFRGSE